MDDTTRHLLFYLKRMLEQMLRFVEDTIEDSHKLTKRDDRKSDNGAYM